MSFTDEQKKTAEDIFNKSKENVTKKEVEEAIKTSQEKIDSFGEKIPETLKELWKYIQLFVSLSIDWWNNKYTDVPWGTIAAIVSALLYFVSPIDLIPDFIPVIGYIDDAYVIGLCLKMVKEDMDKYEKWQKENKKA